MIYTSLLNTTEVWNAREGKGEFKIFHVTGVKSSYVFVMSDIKLSYEGYLKDDYVIED